MAFEVASVRRDTSGHIKPRSFAISADDSFSPTRGSFHADFSPFDYLEFAYKLSMTRDEKATVLHTCRPG